MKKPVKYYSLAVSAREADIFIFGDIVDPIEEALWREWYGDESSVSGLSMTKDINALDVDVINVHINSYGGVVSEGFAIYNALSIHPAKIRTYCDGFACSAAANVFMAGDERIMGNPSALMYHNAWTYARGNADDLEKVVEELRKLSKIAADAYASKLAISREDLDDILKNETWLDPAEALEKGFATAIAEASEQENSVAASAMQAVISRVLQKPTGDTIKNVVLEIDGKPVADNIAKLVKAIEEMKDSFFNAPKVGGNGSPQEKIPAVNKLNFFEAIKAREVKND